MNNDPIDQLFQAARKTEPLLDGDAFQQSTIAQLHRFRVPFWVWIVAIVFSVALAAVVVPATSALAAAVPPLLTMLSNLLVGFALNPQSLALLAMTAAGLAWAAISSLGAEVV